MLATIARVPAFIRNHGIGHFIREIRYRLTNRFYDWRLGVDTCGQILKLSTVGFDNPDFHSCTPVGYRALFHAFRQLPFKPQEISLLDIGCGKGRPLVVGRLLGFQKVRGIELVPSIAQIAQQNSQCEILVGDATTFAIPPDINVVYIANSFSGETLSKVMRNIQRSTRRPMVLIYFNPYLFDEARAEFPWIVLQSTHRSHPWTYSLYSVH